MEEWKDNILKSMDGADQAKPPSDSFSKIQSKLAQHQEETHSKGWMAVAAAILLMISANVALINSYYSSNETSKTNSDSELVSDYNIYGNE